jgi:hypothetical protein
MEGKGVGAHFLVHSILGVEGCVGAAGWGLGWMTSESIIHMDLHKPKKSWLMHSRNTFGARTSHSQT